MTRLLFFIVLVQTTVFCQLREEVQDSFKKPLVSQLSKLENTYNIKFSYNTKVAQNLRIELNIENKPLTRLIEEIENQSGLVIEKINRRYYLIKSPEGKGQCGYLRDSVDNKPISNANILNMVSGIGTQTDEFGFFEFNNIDSVDSLQITCLGYATKFIMSIELNDKNCKSISMQPENIELEEVVAQERLKTGFIPDTHGFITLRMDGVNSHHNLAEPDILSDVQLLPGVYNVYESISDLQIRGGSSDQISVYWDGIKMYTTNHLFGTLSAFNPYIVDEVIIHRDGTKPRFGDAISGIIEIRTDTTSSKKLHGGVGLNLTHGNANIKIPLSSKTMLWFSTRKSLSEFLATPTVNRISKKVFQNTRPGLKESVLNPGISENSNIPSFSDTNLKISFRPSNKSYFEFSSILTKNSLFNGFKVPNQSLISKDTLRIHTRGASVKWKRTTENGVNLKSEAYYSGYDFSYEQLDRFSEIDYNTLLNNSVKEGSLTTELEIDLSKNVGFNLGHQITYTEVSYLFREFNYHIDNNSSTLVNGIFSHLFFDNDIGTNINIGLRTNRYSGLDKFFFEPRVYFSQKIIKGINLNASFELRNQHIFRLIEPSIRGSVVNSDVWSLTQNGQRPMLSGKQFTLGLAYKNQNWSGHINLYSKQTNGLSTLTDDFRVPAFDMKKGSSTAKGMELFLEKKWGGHSSIFSYTLGSNELLFDNLNDGEAFPANNNSTHILNWSYQYRIGALRWILSWQFQSGTPYTEPIYEKDGPIYKLNSINSGYLPSYNRFDFSMTYRFNFFIKKRIPNCYLGISIVNLFNKTNILSRSFTVGIDEASQTLIDPLFVDEHSYGILPNIFFRLQF